ncbi:hypothetical protein KVR01_009189 [Diaporthe batatas]|uniref:uncharacterized protein n=1 Tax=Diaporthe batatas TaxID=748121 RepID=UPI001D04C22B|nr:uncharacterized protein KVR01_009189 [Diaporthe batatas]KAG8160925.1 hypothetical protein KVR01_009189 [Diaporthe batatas]
MSFLSNADIRRHTKPLLQLFDHQGMAYDRFRILRTVRSEYHLRWELYKHGIRDKDAVEEALLKLLFECRNLKDWESGGDNLVEVFRLIKARVHWASNCSTDLIMQLFFAILRARLDCSASCRNNACKVARRVDQVIRYINGVDHLFAEYRIYRDLVLPIHHTIRDLPNEAKTTLCPTPDAVFLQGISGSND